MSGASPIWQDVLAMAVVLAAALYLARRWWPALRNLWRPAPPSVAASADCGTPAPSSSACGRSSGCSGCGSAGAPPQRDHRVAPPGRARRPG